MRNSIVSESNKLQIKCPVFEAPTKVSACVKLRDMVWRGEKPEKRQGCQVAMRCGTCPVAQLVQYTAFASEKIDHYYSDVPVMGRLRKDVLDRISNTLNTRSIMSFYTLSLGEIKMLESSVDRIRLMVGKAPVATDERKAKRIVKKSVPKAAKIDAAAATGDMSAAVND